MAKILKQYEWNNRFYCMAELDNGSSIELKSIDGKDFEEIKNIFFFYKIEEIG